MANKKISDYTEALSVANDDLFEISVDLGGGSYETRKVKKLNMGLGGSPLTTKGDLYTYDSSDARLAVGSDGQVLIADSAEATGLRWGTVSADNMATADLTLTGNRTHDLANNSFTINNSLAANVDFSLSASGDFNWSGQSAGNHFVLNTSASNELQIRGGHPTDWLSFHSTSAGVSSSIFYSMSWYASSGTKQAMQIRGNGYTEFFYNVGIGVYATGSRLQIQGSGATSATTALLVQNSTANQMLKIDDSGGFALGLNASSFGYQSVTIGNGSSTTANVSVAIGNSSSSTSLGAIAIGHLALANGSSNSPSIAIGQESDAAGFRAVALGWRANASGNYAVAIGEQTTSTGGGVAISGTASLGLVAIKGTASAASAIAIGGTASQQTAIAIGSTSEATNFSSVAIGYGAVASGQNSYIIRSSTSGTKTNSTANSMEVNFNETTSTFRFGKVVDGWLNSTGGFAFGASSVDSSAALQVDSTTKGFLPPRMTTTEKNAVSTPATGLVVFDSTLAKLCVYTGAAWETVTSA